MTDPSDDPTTEVWKAVSRLEAEHYTKEEMADALDEVANQLRLEHDLSPDGNPFN